MLRAPALIGLVGKAQHGKDSVAIMLKEARYERYAFADQLKSMALVLDPVIPTNTGMVLQPGSITQPRLSELVRAVGWERAKQEKEVRRFLQALGTEAVREHLGEDSWLDALDRKLAEDGHEDSLDKHVVYGSRVVVSDVRFPNEARWVRNRGGELWKVIRVNEDRSPFENGVDESHPSEAFVDQLKGDVTLRAANLEELESLVDEQIAFWQEGRAVFA